MSQPIDRLLALGWQPLLALLLVEVGLLAWGTRRVQATIYWRLRPRLLSYPFLLPGVALHELAHATAAVALGLGVRQVVLFRPTRTIDGGVNFGWVIQRRSAPGRDAIVAIAPLLLVPPLLLGIALLAATLSESMRPASGALGVLVVLGSFAAFPSRGDVIAPRGALALLAVAALAGLAVYALGGEAALHTVLGAAVLALAVPTVVFGAVFALTVAAS